MAKEIELKLKEGDIAPEFSAETNGGSKVRWPICGAKMWFCIFIPGTTHRAARRRPARFVTILPNLKRPGRWCWRQHRPGEVA